MVNFVNQTKLVLRVTVTPDNVTCVFTNCTCPTINGVSLGACVGNVDFHPVKEPQIEILAPSEKTIIYNTGKKFRVSVEYQVTNKIKEMRGWFWPFREVIEVDGPSEWKPLYTNKSYNSKIKTIPFTTEVPALKMNMSRCFPRREREDFFLIDIRK